MSGWGVSGPFKYGTAAHRATLTSADLSTNTLFFEIDTGKVWRCSNTTGPVWVPFDPNAATAWHDSLANLQALGTDDGLVVGQRAWDTTRKRWVHCKTAVAGSSTWAHSTWETLISTWWSNVATLVYVPWGADLEYPVITAEHISWGPAKAAGEVEAATLYCTGAAGSTVLGFHVEDNTTALVSDTQTVAASTNKDFDFGGSAVFAKGERFHVSIDPTAAELVAFLTLQVRFDWE